MIKDYLLKHFASSSIILLLFIFGILSAQTLRAQDSKGTAFWICFPGNLTSQNTELYITANQASTVTIDIPGLAFNTVVAVAPGGLQTVSIPAAAQVQSQFVAENKGIHITATTEVTVYGMNAQTATTDAFLAFPLDAIGMEYYILGYNKDFGFSNPTQATIVGTQNATTVTITTTVTGGGFVAGVPANIVLQQGQVYQLRSTATNADYSGTKMTADKPISVFGGAQCTNISGTLRACDHLVEQLPALNSWGKSFVTVPLATRLAGDVFRFMAQVNATAVSVNGAVVANLNAGQFHETILPSTSYNRITSNQPILVGQYSRSSQADNVTSDPFFALVPPDEQFLNSYIVSAGTANITANFINLTSPTANIATVKVDAVTVAGGLWVPIAGTTFSGAKVPVAAGVHTITSSLPIGALVYGYGSFDSYGYLGGQSFSPIATVTSLVLSPKTGTAVINTNQCWDALVKDQFNAPVVGVRVDFAIAGPNNGSAGFANTDVNGIARLCYTGTLTGDDIITASVGSITDNATFTWTYACNITVTAKKFYDLNTNGVDDDNLPVAGWAIALSGTDENLNPVGPVNQVTVLNGTTAFTQLTKGTYTVTEGSVAGWVNTTATSANLTLTTCVSPPQVNFGNVCLGAGGLKGGGLGFWANKNGQSLLTADILCMLNSLCLRNADGSRYDPINGCPAPSAAQLTAGKASLKTWLLDAYATNMAYMLSAQFAALQINVLKGYRDASRLIYAPGTASANAADFATLSAVMAEANGILCANGIIGSRNSLRDRAEAIKDALEAASGNRNFVQLQPCNLTNTYSVSGSNEQENASSLVEAEKALLQLKAIPNPSRNFFTLSLITNNKVDRINVRVLDMQGRVMESYNDFRNGQTIRLGYALRSGTYLVEMVQGKERKTQTVIKQ
jgi:IgGFc binding protein/Bacterial Ig-like domain (group 1)/Secretion system C-terminal sorting domain